MWLARGVRWKQCRVWFVLFFSFKITCTKNQIAFRLSDQELGCWPVCWCQLLPLCCRLSGTSQWQDRHLANGNAIAGRRWGPHSWAPGVSRWLKKLFAMNVPMSSELCSSVLYAVSSKTCHQREKSVCTTGKMGGISERLTQASHFRGDRLNN